MTSSCRTLLLAAAAVTLVTAAPSAVPATDKAVSTHADSAEIASQIVQQLQGLGNHKLPVHAARSAVALQAMPSSVQYDSASYYDPYTQDYVVQGPEPTSDPNLTPSGINVNGALGYISYLVLLVLLQSAVEGVAARAPNHRRKRDLHPSEDLVGRAMDALDVSTTLSDVDLPREHRAASLDLLASLPRPVLATMQHNNKARIERVYRYP